MHMERCFALLFLPVVSSFSTSILSPTSLRKPMAGCPPACGHRSTSLFLSPSSSLRQHRSSFGSKVSPQPEHQERSRTSLRSSNSNDGWGTPKPPHSVGDLIQHEHHVWKITHVEQQGSVWVLAARDRSSNQQVQIHVLSIKDTAWSWDDVDSFQKETRQLQSLRHKCFPRVLVQWEQSLASDVRQYRVLRHPAGGQSLQQENCPKMSCPWPLEDRGGFHLSTRSIHQKKW
mmetsp:Transcript_24909/g.59340  ORF Transcript_24909/g.59340 Transcript_24909/m.59340 type:complete len:231 (+) Transcript_24909:202-894(+)